MLQDVLYNLPFLRHSPRSMIEVGCLTAPASQTTVHHPVPDPQVLAHREHQKLHARAFRDAMFTDVYMISL